MLKRLFVVVALIAATTACGKDNPAGPSGNGGITVNGSTVDITIGGSGFTPVAVTATSAAGRFTFAASTVASAALGFNVPSGVGTYAIPGSASDAQTNAIFIEGAGAATWEALLGLGGSGSVKITSQTSTEVKGSFDFTLVALPGTTATGTKRCVGTFTAKLS